MSKKKKNKTSSLEVCARYYYNFGNTKNERLFSVICNIKFRVSGHLKKKDQLQRSLAKTYIPNDTKKQSLFSLVSVQNCFRILKTVLGIKRSLKLIFISTVYIKLFAFFPFYFF